MNRKLENPKKDTIKYKSNLAFFTIYFIWQSNFDKKT